MSLTFDVAPLVEIIAEVRWSDPTAFIVPGPLMGLSQPNNATDEFFMRFGGRAYGSGFQRAERLVPPGFPVPIGQVVYRYRPPEDFHDEMARSALWQVGPGVFTANAVPPYRSWVEFSPLVRAGLEVLFETRPADVRGAPVSSVSLRYVDAFNQDLIGDSTFESFLAEKLGFQVLLPAAIRKTIKSNGVVQSNLSFIMPVGENLTMALSVGQGKANNFDALIMSTVITADRPVEATADAVMSVLDAARDIIHHAFVELTGPLHDVMRPSETPKND